MPTIEVKEGGRGSTSNVEKAGSLKCVKGLSCALVKKTLAACDEYVNPWKNSVFDLTDGVRFMTGKGTVNVYFLLRGAGAARPGGLLGRDGERDGRHVKVRTGKEFEEARR